MPLPCKPKDIEKVSLPDEWDNLWDDEPITVAKISTYGCSCCSYEYNLETVEDAMEAIESVIEGLKNQLSFYENMKEQFKKEIKND